MVSEGNHYSTCAPVAVSVLCCAVCCAVLQGHEGNQAMLGKGNGVDTLLVCLAGFKSKEPADDLEQETMENIFDTLCSCLLLPSNRWGWGQC